MRVIGITGGVGTGKSAVMEMIAERPDCVTLKADEAAERLEKKGEPVYDALVALLSKTVLDETGELDRGKVAARIFQDDALLHKVNRIVHPAVKQYILKQIEENRLREGCHFFFIEAALLIEDGYDRICDELWYIYATEAVRRERLRVSRGYSPEKIDSIMQAQNSDAVFRKYCQRVIDNSGSLQETKEQLARLFTEYQS
ncbi:MAG: dephospho-CoA kinase [Lachnospiraceae bacterium]|nr:dephospho-CoA kinase [Lachnospiraceae bacterium]